MKLTYNFSLEELTTTRTGLPNNPGPVEIENLRALARNVLQPARELLREKIIVNSGYRSKEVNAANNGAKSSQHLKGQAADLACFDNEKLFYTIWKNLTFDQLIWEGGGLQPAWVHVSFKATGQNRGIVLKMINGKYIRLYK